MPSWKDERKDMQKHTSHWACKTRIYCGTSNWRSLNNGCNNFGMVLGYGWLYSSSVKLILISIFAQYYYALWWWWIFNSKYLLPLPRGGRSSTEQREIYDLMPLATFSSDLLKLEAQARTSQNFRLQGYIQKRAWLGRRLFHQFFVLPQPLFFPDRFRNKTQSRRVIIWNGLAEPTCSRGFSYTTRLEGTGS